MQVTLASRRSPDATSNEDFIAATAGCVVVVDGASVPAELGTGCAHGTAWFARRLGTQLLALLTSQPDHSPADNLAQAITDVAALHADTCDLDHPGTPSATVAILREQPDTIDYLVLGDTTILLEQPTGIRAITDDRLEQVAAVQHDAMHQQATGSAAHARSFAQLVTEQRRHRNHPDGFWVASTDPAAAHHALVDTIARESLHRAAVLSDGATRLVDRFGLLDWSSFLAVLAEQGPDAIIAQVRAAEHSDPDGQRWPRGKRHDDASAAFCQRTYQGETWILDSPEGVSAGQAWSEYPATFVLFSNSGLAPGTDRHAVLVAGASYSRHAQGGGIWPDGSWHAQPPAATAANQLGS